jgi:hypothetical protein
MALCKTILQKKQDHISSLLWVSFLQLLELQNSLNIHQIFNRLVAQFGSSFQNTPESLMNGHIATRGKIEYYFKTFSALTVVFVEARLKVGSVEERMNAIAQVMAECDSQTVKPHSLRLEQHPIQHFNQVISTFLAFTFMGRRIRSVTGPRWCRNIIYNFSKLPITHLLKLCGVLAPIHIIWVDNWSSLMTGTSGLLLRL